MCFGGQKTTSVTEVKMPAWMEQGGKDVMAKANEYYAKPYQAYGGQRVADSTPDMEAAFAGLRGVAGRPDNTAEATDMIRRGSGSAADGVANFMNPYLEAVLGPAIRRIQEASAGERKRIGGMANMSGAYGDARHGVLESENAGKTMTAIGDTTGQIGAAGYNTALSASQADLDRLRAGGADIMSAQTTGTNDIIKRLTALLAGGQMQQAGKQDRLDADYDAFQDKQADPLNKLDMLIRALGGASAGAGKTQTEKSPDNSGFSLLGSVLGAMI
jgi:hypothetical protein